MTPADRERERQKLKNRRYRKDNKSGYQQSMFKSRLKQQYGLTVDDYERMWSAQDGRCKVCRVEMIRGGRTMDAVNVDHDHATGRVRGLLCSYCNLALGYAKDDAARLRALADYLDGL